MVNKMNLAQVSDAFHATGYERETIAPIGSEQGGQSSWISSLLGRLEFSGRSTHEASTR